jgi:hypothetical protein
MELVLLGTEESNRRLAELQRRAAAVVAVERAIAEYVSAGGGLPVLVAPVACPECERRAQRIAEVHGQPAA